MREFASTHSTWTTQTLLYKLIIEAVVEGLVLRRIHNLNLNATSYLLQ